MYQGRLKGVSGYFSVGFKGISENFKRRSKGGSREVHGNLKDVLRKFQGCLQKVLSVFQENFKKKLSRVFQECFNEVLFCNFVAATRAEGGLVYNYFTISWELF